MHLRCSLAVLSNTEHQVGTKPMQVAAVCFTTAVEEAGANRQPETHWGDRW